MSTRDVPADWWDLLGRADLVDPRDGVPSMSALARVSGVHASTISAMMYGDRRTSGTTVNKVADALVERTPSGKPDQIRDRVHELVGRALGEPVPFRPHPDADLLTAQERNAVNEMIRLLALPKKGRTILLGEPKPAFPLSTVSEPAGEVPPAVAAHEEEVPTAGEQGESETP